MVSYATAADALAGFRLKIETKHVGIPTYASVTALHQILCTNAAGIISNGGNGALGLLRLCISGAEYTALSGTPFVLPLNPGGGPTIPHNAGAVLIANRTNTYKEDKRIYDEWNAVDGALVAQIFEALDEIYLLALRRNIVGYSGVTALNLLDHLYANYAKITGPMLEENDRSMRVPFDANQPVEILFRQIDDGVSMAARAQRPFSPEQILGLAVQLVTATQLFRDDMKIWKKKPAHDKTYVLFKVFLVTCHQEWHEEQLAASTLGYGQANLAAAAITERDEELRQDTVDAIANLATATASDRAANSMQTALIQSLHAQLAEANRKLVDALERLSVLAPAAAAHVGAIPGAPIPPVPPAAGRPRRARPPRTEGPHYCSSHGFGVWHSSAKCKFKSATHNVAATATNTMGGNQETFAARMIRLGGQ